MSTSKRKLRLAAAFVVVLTLALAVGCRGFFVNPTLTSLTVTPANQSIAPGGELQMTATGTFDDGSTSNVTTKSVWSSSDTAVATVGTSTGKVKAASVIANPPGTTTITAADGTISNTATVNVCPQVTNITLTADNKNPQVGQQVTFTANATFSGSSQLQNVTNQVTWTISNTAVIPSITGGVGTVSSGASGLSTNVTASLCGATSNSVTITVQ